MKGYVDGNFVTKNCATFSDDVADITNNKIVNLANPISFMSIRIQ